MPAKVSRRPIYCHPGESACRSTDLSSQPLQSGAGIASILLLVDCDMPPEACGLRLRLNGKEVPGPTFAPQLF